jgi:carboxylesterase type B
MAPNGQTNLGVQDVMNAMKFLQRVLPAFGGSAQKITIAGQSSGADMVRALLGADSASLLFQSAILQSDPIVSRFITTAGSHLTPASELWLLVTRGTPDVAELLQQGHRLRFVKQCMSFRITC